MKTIDINQVIRAAYTAAHSQKNRFSIYKRRYRKDKIQTTDFMITLTYFIVRDLIKNPNFETLQDDIRKEISRFIGDSERKREVLIKFLIEKSKKKFKTAFEYRNLIANFLGINFYIISGPQKKKLEGIKLNSKIVWSATQEVPETTVSRQLPIAF